MTNLERFLAYAADFEQTLVDDDWSRLRQYFTDDAVYEIADDRYGARLVGPPAIFAGMKKSLDGFDRKFTRREPAITDGPEITGEQLRIGWRVVYHRDGWPPFTLCGTSTARYRDGRIDHLTDSFGPEADAAFESWQQQTGVALDPSYT